MNIILCCGAGMSTSLLVTKMQESAERKELDATIWSTSVDEVKREMDKADIVLLGPQVRYLFKDIEKAAEVQNIPVDMINSADYGLMKGENVLEAAIQKLEQERG